MRYSICIKMDLLDVANHQFFSPHAEFLSRFMCSHRIDLTATESRFDSHGSLTATVTATGVENAIFQRFAE